MFLVSLFGDSIILVASIKYKAFKLHKVIVIFIQHIAACDLLLSFVSILTQYVSLLANRWLFGSLICYVKVYLGFLCNTASVFLICGMTVSKVLTLKFPLKADSWSEKGHVICSGIWILSCCVPGTFLIVDKDDVGFLKSRYTCIYHATSSAWKWLRPILSFLFAGAPIITVVATSLVLLKHLLYARQVSSRSSGNVRWQGIATVVLTAAVYCISFIPRAVSMMTRGREINGWSEIYASRVGETFMYFSVAANFFVYSLTVPSFQKFLKTRLQLMTSRVVTSDIMNSGKCNN